jgi:HEAT repeat protein
MARGRISIVFSGLIGWSMLASLLSAQTPAEVDVQQLQALGLATDTEHLLDFFRQRTLQDHDRPRLEEMVRQLEHTEYGARTKATQQLLEYGPAALPFLREILKKSSLESVRRTEECIKKIEAIAASDAPAVAARVLVQRRAAGAIEALLDYVPPSGNSWLEEEVLASLGRLAIQADKVDPFLLRALADPQPARRATAAYLWGRRGGLGMRARVRPLLADADAFVRRRATLGLAGKHTAEALREAVSADETLVRQNKLEPTETVLLDFLRRRTLDENDQRRLQQLVQELGHPSFAERERASRLLTQEGPPALVFLKPAIHDPDIEVVRRAQQCVEMIRRGPGPSLPTAIVHLLARPQLAGHAPVAVLLAYIPFADDEAVEDAVLTSLVLLSLREAKVDPGLAAALTDAHPARRGAAAYVLGHVGTEEHQPALRRLLDDPAPQVRLRAAQGLLAAHDGAAVPHLIALLRELPPRSLWRVEELLYRLAGENIPAESVASAAPEAREKAVEAWQKWWQTEGPRVDLARLSEHEPYLGLITVAEYDSAVGQPGGRVWEGGREGQPRWSVRGLMGAMDAHVLPNGRILVAENSGNRVTERDLHGNVKWEYRLQGNPICCQRLPNGNTFIALYNQVLEVTPDHKELYRHMPGPQFYIFSAQKTKNGRIIAMTAQGSVLELEATTGKQQQLFHVTTNGNWCGIEHLHNGNFLVAILGSNEVREVDREGKIVWRAGYPGVFRASRLPNGNTLVASMTTRRIAELDRNGKSRWEHPCEGRPWSVHYR